MQSITRPPLPSGGGGGPPARARGRALPGAEAVLLQQPQPELVLSCSGPARRRRQGQLETAGSPAASSACVGNGRGRGSQRSFNGSIGDRNLHAFATVVAPTVSELACPRLARNICPALLTGVWAPFTGTDKYLKGSAI
eukprot:SAG31_NODE_1435_length_8356_cov_148.657503_4_plen_139_part_00